MNRFAVALGVALAAVHAVPATAQTRVAVMLGFALPRPHVSGVIVVGPPYGYDAESGVLVVPAPRRYQYRHPFVVERDDYRLERRDYKGYRQYRHHGDDGEYNDQHGDYQRSDYQRGDH
jgi:hypothetical protein